MSKSSSTRIALLSAAAIGALTLTAVVTAPVQAQDKMMKSEMSGEKTVMVGGAAMFPSKNIVQNAVNSKDHTTLVAAVKAAGLVDTLSSKGPFTVFAPTNAAFGKLPAGTVDTLVKPENKATLTKILTYHVVPGKLAAAEVLGLQAKLLAAVSSSPADVATLADQVGADEADCWPILLHLAVNRPEIHCAHRDDPARARFRRS